MEKVTRCFMSVLLLSAVPSSGLTEEKFFVEGGTLELGPNFSGNIETVTWKLNNDMIAEWLASINDLTYYSTFKGRTTLNKVTGTLNITKLTPADSGVYSVEINNMVRPERYNVKVIKEVPQPVVEFKPLACSAASASCNLSCEGNTKGAEPVTYSWKMGEGEWIDGEKSRTITKETKSIKTFSCWIKNKISDKQSDTKENIFYSDEENDLPASNAGAIVGSVICVLAVAAALVGVGFWKREYVNEKIQSFRGHGKTVTINDAETGTLLGNGTSNGPAGGPGAESTEGAGGPGAESTEGTGGPGAESTQRAGGPGASSAEGAGGPGAESTEGAGGPGASSAEGAGGPGAESTEGAGGPGAESTEGAGGPGAESTEGAGGPGAESTEGAGGPGAESTEGAGGPGAESTEGAGGPDAESTEGAGGPDAESTEGAGGQSAAASKSGTEAGIDEESDTT